MRQRGGDGDADDRVQTDRPARLGADIHHHIQGWRRGEQRDGRHRRARRDVQGSGQANLRVAPRPRRARGVRNRRRARLLRRRQLLPREERRDHRGVPPHRQRRQGCRSRVFSRDGHVRRGCCGGRGARHARGGLFVLRRGVAVRDDVARVLQRHRGCDVAAAQWQVRTGRVGASQRRGDARGIRHRVHVDWFRHPVSVCLIPF